MLGTDPVHDLRPRVQAVLTDFVDRQRSLLGAIGPELLPLVDAAERLLAGGKRLRPAFCYWGWRSVAGHHGPAGQLAHDGRSGHDDGPDEPSEEEAVVAAAAALELFQAAALVHDDLIDGSDTRRGGPSVHRQFAALHRESGWDGAPDAFGAAAAVLLGDLLLGWSDELLSSSGLSPHALERGRPVFERMRTEVGGGQYLDVLEQVSGASRAEGAADRARRVIRYKAARYSVEHPLVLGGRFADAPDHTLAAFASYGSALGEAFQLRDDVLGVFGDPAVTGKPAGDDLREGKRTVLVAYALERADAGQTDVVAKLLGDSRLDDAAVEAVREVIVATGALARVESLVATLVGDAAAALAEADVSAEGRAALSALIELATARQT